MCKSLRILIARNRPGLEILKQSTLICWPRNQLPFTTVARRDKNCCEWDYRDRRVWHAWKKKQKKKTKKQRKERKTSWQLHARKVVCAVTSRNASYMIGRGQMLPPPFRRGSCWPLGIPIRISFPFPIFHQSAYDTKRPARWRREGQIKAGFHQRPSPSPSRNQKI